jgi:hypothetical protein
MAIWLTVIIVLLVPATATIGVSLFREQRLADGDHRPARARDGDNWCLQH